MSQVSLKDRLLGFLRDHKGLGDAEIVSFTSMPGGASKESWAVDLKRNPGEGSVLPLVLRFNRPSPLPVSIDLKQEFMTLEHVHSQGIPVPRPYWYVDDPDGPPFYVLERIEGETIVRRLHRDARYDRARERIPEQLGQILARIHRIPEPARKFAFLPARGREAGPLAEVLFYEQLLQQNTPDPHPVLELTLRWLKQHAPRFPHQVLVHGDFRLGNVIFTEQGLQSVLDWELAHLGDPMEDVGYISVNAWRFGNDEKPIGGIGERGPFYDAYARSGGFPVSPERVFFWEVFGNLKWAVITVLQMLPFLSGSSDSIELASLGRITAEVELELLKLIG